MDEATSSQVTTLAAATASQDPKIGLRAVAALRGLAEVLEALQVDNARAKGWSWQDIASRLGVAKQAFFGLADLVQQPVGVSSLPRSSSASVASPRRAARPGRRGGRCGPARAPPPGARGRGRVGTARGRCGRAWLPRPLGVEAQPVAGAAALKLRVPRPAAERAWAGAVAAVADPAVTRRPERAAEVHDDGLAAAGTPLARLGAPLADAVRVGRLRVLPVGMPSGPGLVAGVAVGVGVAGVTDEAEGGVPALGAVRAEVGPGGGHRFDAERGAGVERAGVHDQPDLHRRVQAARQLAGELGEGLDQLADGPGGRGRFGRAHRPNLPRRTAAIPQPMATASSRNSSLSTGRWRSLAAWAACCAALLAGCVVVGWAAWWAARMARMEVPSFRG